MSVSKASLLGFNEKTESRTKSKLTLLANTFLISVSVLSALDLLVAHYSGDSIANYTISVLVDLILTVIGIIFCSDLIANKHEDSIICFLAYMVFLWICTTVLKLVFLL
ncbi:hypothetical protein SAMN02746098_02671 [Desulfosporosinus lacus DSM 15449]|uniref:Uncharacterized protein n=1 Tax=Desulfosporosinus lacus DSM 15449 TaxID=1121420 RepID=A0A1M5YQV6_9FIRM|nr:hypothetical protein SAMN02746098_02671 [Desulfosporosinus lacus DSM 15449]